MLKGFGFQESLEIEGRMFKIHTGYQPEKNLAMSEVFEHGNFIFNANEKLYLRKPEHRVVNEEYLKNVTKKIHQDTMEEIRVLFNVNEKIKLIKQPQTHFRLGKIFYVRNFIDEAVDNFKRAIRLKPDFVNAHKFLGLTYLKEKNFSNAQKIMESILDIGNNYPDILNTLGVIYIHFHQYEKARKVLQKALSIRPEFIQANFNLGLLLFLSALEDDPSEKNIVIPARIQRFLKQIKAHSQYQSPSWKDLYKRVDTILESNDREKIIDVLSDLQLRLAINEDLNITVDFFFIKFMYGGKELSQNELNYYERLIREEGKGELDKYADYWNELGVVHLIQCRDYFLKAMAEFENATVINPRYEASLKSLELVRRGKNGFLILLRAILK